jgi:hypothetical protein
MSKLTIKEDEWLYPEGNLSKVIKDLQEKLDDGWQKACCEIQLFRTREETDKEYTNRLEVEEREKQVRLRHYKELRKEFGDLV